MAAKGIAREGVADYVGVAIRTVTNWTTGKTMPDDSDRAVLRQMFPGYDSPGDPVEVAILHSELTEDRRYSLLGTYKRLLREQEESATG